jgi:hypothetical protein
MRADSDAILWVIWVNFGGSCNGSCWYILCPFGLSYCHLVYFVAIWHTVWLFGTFFPVLVCCATKNLATQGPTAICVIIDRSRAIRRLRHSSNIERRLKAYRAGHRISRVEIEKHWLLRNFWNTPTTALKSLYSLHKRVKGFLLLKVCEVFWKC